MATQILNSPGAGVGGNGAYGVETLQGRAMKVISPKLMQKVPALSLKKKFQEGAASLMSLIMTGARKDYEIHDAELGRGHFGVVKPAYHRKTRQPVAVKIVTKKNKTEQELNLIRREIQIMQRIHHKNCVEFYAQYETKSEIYIVMEMATGGQLLDRIIEKKHYSECEAARFFVQMMTAIDYLHSIGIVHRDLKPENILLAGPEPDSPIKIADYGLANYADYDDLQEGRKRFWSRCGSPEYVAPEVLQRDGYGMECDVWSAGAILYLCLGGEPPFDQSCIKSKFSHIRRGRYDFPPARWDAISSEAKCLIQHMLCCDTKARYTARQCLESEWVTLYHAGCLSDAGLPDMQSRLRAWAAECRLMAAIHTCAALARMRGICGGGGAHHDSAAAPPLPRRPDFFGPEDAAEQAAALRVDPSWNAELRQAFLLLDRDRDGRISLRDLAESLRAIRRPAAGRPPSASGCGVAGHVHGTPPASPASSCASRDWDDESEEEALGRLGGWDRGGGDGRGGDMSFEEFAAVMEQCVRRPRGRRRGSASWDEGLETPPPPAEEEEKWDYAGDHAVYDLFDAAREGFITPKSLQQLFGELKCAVTLEEAEAMVRVGDRHGKGCIDFTDFVALLHPTDPAYSTAGGDSDAWSSPAQRRSGTDNESQATTASHGAAAGSSSRPPSLDRCQSDPTPVRVGQATAGGAAPPPVGIARTPT